MECCFVLVLALLLAGLLASSYRKGKDKDKEQEHDKRMEELEVEKVLQEGYARLYESGDYALIETFVAKHTVHWAPQSINWLRGLCDAEKPSDVYSPGFLLKIRDANVDYLNLVNLQNLLATKSHFFSTGDLLTIVARAMKSRTIQEGKIRILRSRPRTHAQTLIAFMEISSSRHEDMLISLALALRETGLKAPSTDDLRAEIETLEQKERLKAFERNLLENCKTNSSNDDVLREVDEMNGYDFEEFVKVLFVKMGYDVIQTPLSCDQGADLVVTKYGERFSIQAKRASSKVGNRAVQEVQASLSYYQTEKGILITNSYFTPSAVRLGAVNQIQMIDRTELEGLVAKYW